MKNVLFCLVMALMAACSSSRRVDKTRVSVDSVSVKKGVSFIENDQLTVVLKQDMVLVKDTVTTKADSATTNFFYNGQDTAENYILHLETGNLVATVVYNKKTGVGKLTAVKKPETLMVNRYESHTTMTENHGRHVETSSYLDSSELHVLKDNKKSESHRSSLTIGIIILLLFVAILVFYSWYKRNFL